MLVERYARIHVILFQNLKKTNQFVLLFIESKIVFFYSIDDFVSRFFQNFAVSFREFIVRQNVNVVNEVDKV